VFSDDQYADPHFQFDRWEEDSYLGWIPGRRLFSGEEIYVRAQLVLFIHYRQEDEPRIGVAPSGGLASHVDDRQAICHAVTELIERDAVNLRWHGRVPLDRIVMDVEPADRELRRALKRLEANVAAPDVAAVILASGELGAWEWLSLLTSVLLLVALLALWAVGGPLSRRRGGRDRWAGSGWASRPDSSWR
jgi:ribosomal protein S12 methylthiotransferase accessory factor YcaO